MFPEIQREGVWTGHSEQWIGETETEEVSEKQLDIFG